MRICRSSVLLDDESASYSLAAFIAASGTAFEKQSVEDSGPPFGRGAEPRPHSLYRSAMGSTNDKRIR